MLHSASVGAIGNGTERSTIACGCSPPKWAKNANKPAAINNITTKIIQPDKGRLLRLIILESFKTGKMLSCNA
jgi:hypothetical protein